MIEHDAGAITAGPPAASALLKRAERTARSQCTLLFITENTQIVNEKISEKISDRSIWRKRGGVGFVGHCAGE